LNSPHQIEELAVNKSTRLPKLLAIAEITHKYHFVELSAWCIGSLKAMFSLVTIPPLQFERLLRVAILSNDKSFCAAILSMLSARLLDGTLPPTDILIVADRHDIHALKGVAYYAQLMALQKSNSNELTFPAGVSLNRDQRVSLLAGYWSLVRMWERIRATPFQDSSPCLIHGSSCAYALNIWRGFTNGPTIAQFSLADVLGKLKALQSMLQNEIRIRAVQLGPAAHLATSSACKAAVTFAAQKIPNDIQASLQDYFSDRILGLDDES
jgi:hypothetical protein